MGNSAIKEIFFLDEFSLMKHDTSNRCMRFKTGGIKKMLRGVSGGRQEIKFANTCNRGWFRLFYQNERTI